MNGPLTRAFATEELDAAQRAAIIAVCIAAHDSEDFARLFSFIPSGGRHFMAYLEGEIVSHAVVTTRWAQPAGLPVLRTAFVDAVSTLPSAQGRGFATATMEHLAAGIADYELACLQTDLNGFYERIGWRLWRGPLAGRDGDEIIPTPDQRGVMVHELPSSPALDLDALLTIERQPDRIWE